ncbi:hypothetical protein [Microlunatus soli]|uniref:hypothetical protein n=1 Tax=Microlunatus soli TaxID=630515 RepID=UPI0012F7212C|nr:hypothetical protein [Microlunatus soli]
MIRLEDGIAETRAIARTVDASTRTATEWDRRFREPWLELMTESGRRIADPDADVAPLRRRAERLAHELSGEELTGLLWPTYGALISNLINIIDVVDDVASSIPVRT